MASTDPLLTDPGEIVALAEYIESVGPDGYVAWDTESGATEEMRAIFPKAELHPYVSAYCTGLSLCVVERPGMDPADLEGVYVPVGHPGSNAPTRAVRRLLRALNRTDATQVTHHCLHDWPILAGLGLGYRPPDGRRGRRRPHIDTQVVAWHQDENRVKGLKPLGEMYLDEDAAAEKEALDAIRKAPYGLADARRVVVAAYPELGALLKNGKRSIARPGDEGERLARQLARGRSWGQITAREMAEYAARDATLTAELAEFLLQAHPVATVLSKGQKREHDYQGVLYRLTERGVSVKLDELDSAAAEYARRAEVVRIGLEEEFGIENPASPDQCKALLYGKLGLPIMGRSKKTGSPSADKNALEMLQGHPVAARVLEYRKWKHAEGQATTYGNHARYSTDGRIHGHFSSTQTVTGRLSASGPNVMNVPRDDSLPEIRRAFYTAKPGFKRYGFDINSAELWVTASVTQDPLLTETLMSGANLHATTMVQVFGGEMDKTRREYTLSKNVNFGIEYGAGLDQITVFAAKAGYSPREARRVAKKMRDGHKEAYAVQHRMAKFLAQHAEKVGKIPLYGNNDRYRHFWSPGKRIHAYTALNALVQGGVAEFVKDTMLALDNTWARNYLVLQVHDELAFDAPDEPGMEARLHKLLTKIAADLNPFRYPLVWSAKTWEQDLDAD